MQVRILSQIYPGSVSSHILLYLISNYIFAQMDMEIGMSRKKGFDDGHVEKCMQMSVVTVVNWANEWFLFF